MHIRTAAAAAAAAAAIAAIVLTGCAGTDTAPKATATASPSATQPGLTDQQKADALKAAGIPPEPTGEKRAQLLAALAAVNPDIVKYDGKAIDAARNQCSAINGGAQNLDHTASVRFTYKDVTTTESQGKQINQALKSSSFCKV